MKIITNSAAGRSATPLHFWEPKSVAISGLCTATHGPHVPSKALFFLWPHFPPVKQKSFGRKSEIFFNFNDNMVLWSLFLIYLSSLPYIPEKSQEWGNWTVADHSNLPEYKLFPLFLLSQMQEICKSLTGKIVSLSRLLYFIYLH